VRPDVRTLRSLIDEGRRFEIEHAVYFIIESCKAFAHADPRGAISPIRILISSSGDVALDDPFAPDALREGLGYVAPEIVPRPESDRSLTMDLRTSQLPRIAFPIEFDRPAAAVFSIGCVLWELLAGRPLFRGENDYQTLQLAAAAVVPPLSSVPRELETLVRKALAKNLGVRYRNPEQLAKALGDYLLRRARN